MPELSVAVLAKDRLPADFQGSYAELCAQYPEFMQTTGKRETNSVVKNLHSHRINHFIAGDTLCTDDGVEMSATRVRKALVEKNTAQLQQLLDPKLYQVLVTTENLERMERRYRLAQERKEKLMSNTDQQLSLKTTLAQQKTLNPLTGTPLPIEKGKQKQVNKVFLKKKEYSDADKAVIETYLTEIEAQYQQNLQALTQEKKQLENTYKERIRSKENRLQFST
ncbi:MAG: hypothetical protein LBU27_00410 [Candidatus Peribacteria bacterium]|nr:hypothetical protein [Candidatus Peribacteria bacterium]